MSVPRTGRLESRPLALARHFAFAGATATVDVANGRGETALAAKSENARVPYPRGHTHPQENHPEKLDFYSKKA
jgi:hypothetical protein